MSFWIHTKDGDRRAFAMFQRHYTYRRKPSNEWNPLFAGPGEKIVLVTPDYSALFVWRKFRSLDKQDGINCAIFRNEGPELSSKLILEAEMEAWKRWPGARLYTYVGVKQTEKRRSKRSQPGQCFIHAGWQICGVTKRYKLTILEKFASKESVIT